MILEQLTLHNFCLYHGEQAFYLAPGRNRGKALPIVLFGGMNGGGKTTLLDAIQLALYGSRARCSKRANLSYEDYLRECIHRRAGAGDGAAVALSFRYAAEGEEHLYEVRRSWQTSEGKLRESLHVSRDGVADKWLSDNWQQLVEELIPLGISQLFFFDAEKIRFLADDETGHQALGAAIKALLGLDLAERLIADAAVLESRCAKTLVSDEDAKALNEFEAQIAAHKSDLDILWTERAAVENELQRAENEKRKAEDRFASIGGKHWENREARKRELHQLEAREESLKEQLVSLASGELPFALVQGLLQRIAQQGTRSVPPAKR